ncbi:uncharacterized protein LOC127750504 [Frankliniella occidentalis]|uniref:Uncharacterized protein LOC127750504 n=1 Tax=Frankliniella occidentalis TaxID=133901 RepID=A0A9C6X350_FRAOC|nr:uncharacterized protein LOC127750504 [Frankliniella occidentalis]
MEESALLGIQVSQAARDLMEWERRNFSRHVNARQWLLREKCFSLSIYKRSPKTYRYLRQHFTLPCEKTLKNVLDSIHIEPEISQVFLKILEKKTFNSLDKDKVAVVAFDEVFAEENLTFSNLLDLVNGFEDFGARGRTHKKADHVLVFKVKLLNTDTDLPIAHYPVHATCPSDMLALLLEDVCRALPSIGITVVASVSDQGSTNRGAIAALREKCDQGEFDNVYQVDGKLIVHLWDFPRLLKNLRNNLLPSNLYFEENKLAKWRHIIEFFKLDEGICKISRLKYAHLAPVGRNKMHVHLAAQIFSEQNFKGMKTFHTLSDGRLLSEAMNTAELLMTVDTLFDSVNGPSRRDKPKDGRCDVTPSSYYHFVGGMKTVLVQKLSAKVRGTNCEQADEKKMNEFVALLEVAINCQSVHSDATPGLLRAHDPADPPPRPFNKLTRQGPSLTCGTICTKVLEATGRCQVT